MLGFPLAWHLQNHFVASLFFYTTSSTLDILSTKLALRVPGVVELNPIYRKLGISWRSEVFVLAAFMMVGLVISIIDKENFLRVLSFLLAGSAFVRLAATLGNLYVWFSAGKP